jgi:hypothetical protein
MKKLFTYLSASVATILMPAVAYAQQDITPIDGLALQDVFDKAVAWIAGIAGMIAVIYLIYGGVSYITGGAGGAENAKKIIINAIIGIVVILLAYTIVGAILGIFK